MSQSDDQKRLDSNIEMETKSLATLGGVDGETAEEVQVLGYATISTIGDAEIPRDWLVQRADELGLPEYLMPGEPRPSSAYKRAVRRLLDGGMSRQYVDGREVNLELRNPDHADPNVRIVEAAVHFAEDETGTEGGEYSHHQLGILDYDVDTQDFRAVKKLDSDAQAHDKLLPLWKQVTNRMNDLFDRMQTHNLGEDIRDKTLYRLRTRYTNTTVSLRDGGGVYFFPVEMADIVESLATLLKEVNREFKKGGRTMGLQTMPVFDQDSQREWIESRVEQELEQTVDSVIDAAFEELEEGETASDIVQVAVEELGDAFETAEQYNQLLEAELSIESFVRERMDSVKEQQKEEILEGIAEGDA
jgi:hypothetical protein